MDDTNPTQTPSAGEAARLEACKTLADDMQTAWRVAKGIADSMLELSSEPALYSKERAEWSVERIIDVRRWRLFCQMLNAADHELGRAIR